MHLSFPCLHCKYDFSCVFIFILLMHKMCADLKKNSDKHWVHTCYAECLMKNWKQRSHYLCYWSHQSWRSQPGISLGFFWWRCAPSSSGWTSPHYGRQWLCWRWGGFHHRASFYTYRQIYIYNIIKNTILEVTMVVELILCCALVHTVLACIGDSCTLVSISILWKQVVRQETATLHTVSSV